MCAARDPGCDWLATRGGLERQTMLRALTARGYTLDPSPWDKVVGKIHIYNEDVFAEGHRLLKLLNHFHITTKDHTIRIDVVIRTGEVYTPERVQETERRLRDPLFSSVIVVVPVTSAMPGTVDLLVITRDIWSLRLNTQYTFQQGTLTDLAMSLSENNFAGRRNVLAAAFTMDQGQVATGPLFIDKNVLGEHLELRARANTILNRDALLGDGRAEGEGSSSDVRLSKVLWKLSSPWGGSVAFSHRSAIERAFDGLDLRQVRCVAGDEGCTFLDAETAATTPAGEKLPLLYRSRVWGVTASAVRQWGSQLKHLVTVGHTVDSIGGETTGLFDGTAAQRALFEASVLPPIEVNSAPFVGYSLFRPEFRTRRNVQTYDLAEDLRIGPDLDVTLGVGTTWLGSTRNFLRSGISGGWTIPWGRDGSARLAASYSTRYQDGQLNDNLARVSTRVVSPVFGSVRLVMETTVATRWDDRRQRFFSIGSDNGLRGYRINQFIGRRLANAQVELRTQPRALWVLRLGGVLFYDVGDAGRTVGDLSLHHDVGIGLRSLLPQTSRELFRFDLAFPLDGPDAGLPRFIAGFQSEF